MWRTIAGFNQRHSRFYQGKKKEKNRLFFLKMDENKMVLESVSFSVSQIIEESLEIVSFEAERKGLELVSVIEPSVPTMIVGDPVRLRM